MTSRLSDAFVQKKRIAHRPQDGSSKSKNVVAAGDAVVGTSKSADIDKKDQAFLKQFDLTLEYGPCIGISRLERWERAERHGLNPPKQVKNLIESHPSDPSYTECLWNDYNTLK